jgi:hypothetical protein
MFLGNKYTATYFRLLTQCCAFGRQKLCRSDINFIYYENHHIIPKSLGGSDKKENLVLLSPREHFICHWLLLKMVVGEDQYQKMLHAFSGMYNWKEKRNLSSRQYQIIKNSVANRKQSDESNRKRSLKLKGRPSTRKGKTLIEFYENPLLAGEIGKKISSSNKGKKKPGTSTYMKSRTGERNNRFGRTYMWITDGKNDKLMETLLEMPIGFRKGRSKIRNSYS